MEKFLSLPSLAVLPTFHLDPSPSPVQSLPSGKHTKNPKTIGIINVRTKYNKKAVLSQRWPRNAPYRPTWVPWKLSGLPDYAHGYYSQHFSRAFVRIDPMNVPSKFEVRSFTRSWDNRGYPKNLGTPRIRPRSLFSEILISFYSDCDCKCTCQIWSP